MNQLAVVRRRRVLESALATIDRVEPRQLLTGFVPLAPTPSPWATGYFAQASTVDLQAGAAAAPLLAGTDASSLPRNVPVNANGLPLLNSRAGGAGTELFIDFARNADGRGTFSLDGDRENFNFAEQTAIYHCWREIVGFFSAFNLNVTTVLPPTGPSDPNFSWIQITNDWVGGNAYVNWLSKDGPKGTVNSGDAVNRVSGIIHEYGHNLGLNHQGEFDKYGNKTEEYSDGYSYRSRPIMGVDYLGAIRQMTVGRTTSSGAVQDDVAVIANTASWSNGQGGDGYRPDDFGNTIGTAYTLPAGGQALDAFTERYNDADVFKITPTTAGAWNITATPLYLSQAEPKLELLDANGNVFAARDDADARNGPTNEQMLNVNLEPGTYYIRVTSGGDYAELGYYKFAATQLPTGFVSNDVGVPAIPGSVTYNASNGTFSQSGGGGDIWGTSDQFRYTYATLTGNGSITARVDSLDNTDTYAKAGVMIRQSMAGDSQHAFLGIRPGGGIESVWRSAPGANSATVNNNASGPWVRITRSGNTFTYQRSSDGLTWTTLGTNTISMTGPVLIGLATTSHSGRFEAFSTFSNVGITGNITPAAPTYNALPAPTNLLATAAAGASTAINLAWDAVAGATGYLVERSIDGVNFGTIANLASSITSYVDANLFGSMRYFYRVSAKDGSASNSAPAAVNAINKPGAPGLTPGGFTPSAMAIGTTEVQLTWVDTSGETGYRIESSTDGVNWVTRFTNPANHSVSNVGGLLPGTAYTFRITPLTNVGDGVATPLLINTQTRMPAVTNLRFTAKSSTSMTIAWNVSSLEAGYRVERSTDGTNWTFMGDTAAGVTTYTSNGLTPGTEYYFRVMPWNASFDGIMSGAIFAAAPAASQPTGWISADIGTVAGSGTALNTGTGAWKLVSGGYDVAGNADRFHHVYRTLANNQTITARLDALENTDNAAKAGLMIRQDATTGSKFVAIMMNAGGGYGIDVRSRVTANTNYNYQQAIANVTAPYWLRLSRTGGSVIASYSADGTTWTTAATINLSLTGSFLVGLASTSFSTTLLNTSTFSNVSVGSTPPTVATPAAASNKTPTSVSLDVVGADTDDGEAALTYTWSAAPGAPAPVTFTPNGTNASKSATATFTKAGTYTLIATITDPGGLSVTSSVTVVVGQAFSGLVAATTVVPTGTRVPIVPVDQFGDPLAGTAPTFNTSAGQITQDGLFTAPLAGVTSATINATLNGTTQTTTVSIVAGRAWYKADDAGATLIDSSGANNNATLNGAYISTAGKSGNAVGLTGGHARLPNGIVNGLTDFTISTWVYLDAEPQWARIFDFGTGQTANMFLTNNSGAGTLRFAITTSGGGGEQQINAAAIPTGTWTHVAVTLVGNVGTLYVNGVVAGTNANMTLRPANLGATTLNYLGKSQYNDPAFLGKLDDFRILGVGLNASGVNALEEAWQVPSIVLGNVSDAAELFGVASHTLRFTFDRDVGAQDWAATLEIKSDDGTRTITPTGYTYDAGSRTLTVALPAAAQIADGNYVATLRKGAFLTEDRTLPFFALAGDANRDRAVNFDDLLALARNYGQAGKTLSEGDADGDGTVDFNDLLALARNYNQTLAAPANALPGLASTATTTRTRRTTGSIFADQPVT